MSPIRTLKPDQNITGALIPLSILPIFGIVTLLFNLQAGLYTVAIFSWVFAFFFLLVFARTGNYPHLFIFLWSVILGLLIGILASRIDAGADSQEMVEFKVAYLASLLFFGIIILSLALTRQLKWRGREIFELAGEQVGETSGGYTNRPRPVGRMDYTPEQIHDFARFLARNLIALPFTNSKNITLVLIKMGEEYGRLLGLSGDYREATWVNFDMEGEVSVHIAQKDYLDYREPLSFDPLCKAMGQVFIDFFELYKIGEGTRAIDRMNDLKIAFLS